MSACGLIAAARLRGLLRAGPRELRFELPHVLRERVDLGAVSRPLNEIIAGLVVEPLVMVLATSLTDDPWTQTPSAKLMFGMICELPSAW